MNKLVTILTIISFVFGAFFVLETRHASSGMVSDIDKMVKHINKRLEGKILSDQLHDVRKEMREIKRYYPDRIITEPEDIDDYDKLKEKSDDLKTLIDKLLEEL